MAAAPTGAAQVPGEVGIWVLVLGEMTIFAVLFCTYAYYRGLNPELYLASQATLNRTCGLINTLLLLTSSWFVALGVQAVKQERAATTTKMFKLAFACGAAFVLIKLNEYHGMIARGVSPAGNEFYAFYYVLTGLHLLHVLIGMIILAILWRLAGRAATSTRVLESGATYWHMVDVLWVILFPLLYLIRGSGS